MEKIGKELFGYKKQEVNQWIEETVVKTEDLLEKIQIQEQQIEWLEKQVGYYQKSEANLRSFLENSAGNPMKIRENAVAESERILKEARQNADRIISDAIEQAEKLETKKIKIEKDLRSHKNQLRTIIEQETDIMEQIEDLEMGN